MNIICNSIWLSRMCLALYTGFREGRKDDMEVQV